MSKYQELTCVYVCRTHRGPTAGPIRDVSGAVRDVSPASTGHKLPGTGAFKTFFQTLWEREVMGGWQGK